jgi:hypothetical protein
MTSNPDSTLLRHAVATLAYRASKVLRDFPADAAATRASPSTRTPLELLSHLGDLLEWAVSLAHGESIWKPAQVADWKGASERFYRRLAALDAELAQDPGRDRLEQILQGPIADALTHVGQLALLRGMCGAPVRPESYARADIRAGQVGSEQPLPRKEFQGDASFPRRERGAG